jgi:hypothetical protein
MLASKIEIIETLYHFDGPVLFVGKAGLLQAIFLKTDESDDSEEFVSCYVDTRHVNALKDGRISIRGVFEAQKDIFVVQINSKLEVILAEKMEIERLNYSKRLPKPGAGLFPRMGDCPDVLQEEGALLSVYFKGDELSRGRIPYSTLMSLLGTVQQFARNVVAPPELRNLRSSTFDFMVADPALGSLMISIMEPRYNLGKLRQGGSRRSITPEEIRSGVQRHKNELFVEMEDLIQSSGRALEGGGEDTYQSLKDLLPSDHTPYQSVTFSTSAAEGIKRISIDTDRAEAVRAVHDKGSQFYGPRAGVITEINSGSSTFLLKSPKAGRVTTCLAGNELFETLRARKEFRIGARAKVTGDLTKRPRRDFMWVRRVDELEAN